MRLSLRTRFAIYFAIVSIVMTVLLTSVIGIRTTREVREEIGNSLSETSYQMASALDQFMWSRYTEISIISKLNTLQDPNDIEAIQHLLNLFQQDSMMFSWIGYLDVDGNVLAATGDILVGENIASRPVYQEGIKGLFIGDVHDAVLLSSLLPNPTGEPLQFVDISLPIVNDNGETVAVLASHLSWEWAKEVESIMLAPTHNRKDIDLMIISHEMDTVLLGTDAYRGEPLLNDSVRNARQGQNYYKVETFEDGDYLTGYMLANGYREYPGLDWVILARQPLDVAYAPLYELQSFFIIVSIVFALGSTLIGWFLGGLISKPLKEISIEADRLALGDKAFTVNHKSIKEIESLEISLRRMVKNLTLTESKLNIMEDKAHKDPLTKLPNRLAYANFIENIKTTNNLKPNEVAILYIDLDGFKKINDTLGHGIGDELLAYVANIIRPQIQKDDLAARIGGDEFVVILRNQDHPITERALALAQLCLSYTTDPAILNGHEIKLRLSIGITVSSQQNDDLESLIKTADQAMYQAKKDGNTYVFIP